MKKYRKQYFNEQGQTLLFVVVAMTIALALGISISTRTMSSLSRTIRSDTADRVRAVAEGGIERLLRQPESVLAGGIANATDCQNTLQGSLLTEGPVTYCVFQFVGSDFTSQAKVVVNDFNSNAPNEMYRFVLEKDSLTEINVLNLGGEDLRVCWNGTADLYYILYSSNASAADITGKEGISSGLLGGFYDNEGFDLDGVDGSVYGYDLCASPVNIPATTPATKYMRIRAIGDNAIVAVGRIDGGELPTQGHIIESTGELLTDDGSVRTQKKVTVYKSYPFLPAPFDFGVYSGVGWGE